MSRLTAAVKGGPSRHGVDVNDLQQHMTRFSSVKRLRPSQCLPSSETPDENVSTSKVEKEFALSNRKLAIKKTPQQDVFPVFCEWLDCQTVSADMREDIKGLGESLQKMVSTPDGKDFMEKSQKLMAKIGQKAGNVWEAFKWGLEIAKEFALRNPGKTAVVFLLMAFTFITILYSRPDLTIYGLGSAFTLILPNIMTLLGTDMKIVAGTAGTPGEPYEQK